MSDWVNSPPELPTALADSRSTRPTEPLPAIEPRTYGERPTFCSQPWWSDKGWWKVAENGEGNDVRAHVGTVGELAVAAASLRGNKHRLSGSANQDSFTVTVARYGDERSFLIAAIADGLGSARYSGFGARTVAHATCESIRRRLAVAADDWHIDLQVSGRAILDDAAAAAVGYRAGEFDAPPTTNGDVDHHDLQCTLTFVVLPIAAPEESMFTVVVGSVGDSPALLLREGEWMPLDAQRADQGVWSTATEGALTALDFDFTVLQLTRAEALLLATDGLSNYTIYQGAATPLGLDLAHLWRRPIGAVEFIRDLAFEAQSADDDRTAVMIWVGMAP